MEIFTKVETTGKTPLPISTTVAMYEYTSTGSTTLPRFVVGSP